LTTGLATTLETLSTSRNDAANPLLLLALESADSATFDGVLRAMIARRHKPGHLAVLERWHLLSAAQRTYLQEGRGRMSGALRTAVLSDDTQLFTNACELIEAFLEFDLISTLVTLAENQKSDHAEAATQLILRLVQQLSEMIHRPSDTKDRRDPKAMQRHVLESLERSLTRFRTHKRRELVEALVLLSDPTSSTIHKILDEPRLPCYQTVIHTLTHSDSPGVIKLLLSCLQVEHASLNLLNVISRRNDPQCLSELYELATSKASPHVKKNLSRIRSFPWLEAGAEQFADYSEPQQVQCIRLTTLAGVSPDAFLDLLEIALQTGAPAARLAACEALVALPGDRGNHLILDAIVDSVPEVQAAATGQIRNRHIPGAMTILLKQLESPYEVVRKATRESLTEFSFANFLASFEGLHEEARRTTGQLVKKVDLGTLEGIRQELEEDSRSRRLRAISIAEVMELVPQLSEELIFLLGDDDHLVRSLAADALQFCPTAEVQTALRHAANDKSSAVRNAAKGSLEVFDQLPLKPSASTESPV
jgi:hypothetical protein